MAHEAKKIFMKYLLILLLFISPIAIAENTTNDLKTDNKTPKQLSTTPPSTKKSPKKSTVKHCSQHSLKTLRKKSEPYNQAINEASSKHGISTALIRSIITAESCFKPTVVSPAGATGLMQLMPATAKRFGIFDLKNPQKNIQAGTRYLRYLLDLYQGNVLATIAAYNAGEGAVKRFSGEVPAYKETKAYVKRVMSLYDKFFYASQRKIAK